MVVSSQMAVTVSSVMYRRVTAHSSFCSSISASYA
jgi:hypothetical protein